MLGEGRKVGEMSTHVTKLVSGSPGSVIVEVFQLDPSGSTM